MHLAEQPAARDPQCCHIECFVNGCAIVDICGVDIAFAVNNAREFDRSSRNHISVPDDIWVGDDHESRRTNTRNRHS
jgi:hypothetical protein